MFLKNAWYVAAWGDGVKLETMSKIKQWLDPERILNPGKVLPL